MIKNERNVKNYVTVELVKKGWKPNLTKMPNHNHEIDKYPGTVKDTDDIFSDPENMFDCYEKPLENFFELLTVNYGYDPLKESIFIFRNSNSTHSELIRNTVLAMAMRNRLKTYNIFTVGIKNYLSWIFYAMTEETFGKQETFHDLAKTIGDYFNSAIERKLIMGSQIHLIGWCWTGRMWGYIAKHVKETNKFKQKIGSLLALDPFSTGMASVDPQVLLADDANVVQVYHTNSILFGTFNQKANLDIIFNNGVWQPGCERIVFCSHFRSVKLLWYVILYPDLFSARKCDTWSDFENCRCDEEETLAITFPPTLAQPTENGVYYLRTLPKEPFGLGAASANGCENNEEGNDDIKNN